MVTRLPGDANESMAPSSVNEAHDRDGRSGSSTGSLNAETVSTQELLEQLQADRAWLLQQIDGGSWPELRLDLAALERELGQLLEQAQRSLDQA